MGTLSRLFIKFHYIMSYQGGKQRIGKEIHDVILRRALEAGYDNRPYFEPFVGLCGTMRWWADYPGKRIANDSNQDIILLLKSLQKEWNPPVMTREEYMTQKSSSQHSALRGYASLHSYRGMIFAGYDGGHRQGHVGRSLVKLTPLIKGVRFLPPGSYERFRSKKFIIYCDPPYKGTTSYRGQVKFDSEKFWEIMRLWSKDNLVFISESIAPDDFEIVWSRVNRCQVSTNKGKARTENLYVYRGTA